MTLTALPESEWGPDGAERVAFEVCTNPGQPFGPLAKIASGGELSRFMLGLKVVLAACDTFRAAAVEQLEVWGRRNGVPVIRGQLTKFMVLEVVAALIVLALFTWLARKAASGTRPMGRLWNMLESIVVFVRDEIA